MARFVFRNYPVLLMVAIFFHAARSPVRAEAVRPSETLLPDTTKGYISVPDVDALRDKWNETQIGQLVKDPLMQPFMEDLRRQIRAKLSQTGVRVGITWEDLDGVYGGEVCVALIQPWDRQQEQRAIQEAVAKAVEKAGNNEGDQIEQMKKEAEGIARDEQNGKRSQQCALAMLVDVTGHQKEAEALLDKVSKNLLARGAKKEMVKIAAVDFVVFTMAKKEDGQAPHRALYCIHQNRLIATDHQGVAEGILSRFAGEHEDSLEHVKAFRAAMSRCEATFGDIRPHVRWFVEPFGYMEIVRAYSGGRKARGTDILKVLANQGFTAVQGLGGYMALATGEYELLHHTLVLAPPVERDPGDPSKDKYDLAARMLDFPNSQQLAPQKWIPRELATYLTFHWKMQDAFEYSASLVNEFMDDPDIFEEVLKSIETDPNGPQISIRKELAAHLGERATLISDYRLPIEPKSERMLLAIELDDPAAVMRTVNKAMEADPEAKKREHKGHVIWEMLNQDQEVEEVKIDFGFGGEEEKVEEEEKFRPNAAVTVAHGSLIVASHLDYVADVLEERAADDTLEASTEYQTVRGALEKLGADDDSFRFFTRTDEAYRGTYELIRQGKMPQSESLLGKLLNRIWEPEEEGAVRQQQIEGSKMPDYQAVRRYLGPAGMFVRSEDQGWFVAGCLLTKDAE